MASSSNSRREEEDEGWLHLGLASSWNHPSFVATPPQKELGLGLGLGLGFADDGCVREPSCNYREFVGDPLVAPRREDAGVWFCLRTCSTQCGEREALPQLPKAYIRVKDEKVTVLMVKKYLLKKLGLTSEVEIELSCMGKRLSHMQTLKWVRDEVWLPGVTHLFKSVTAIESKYPLVDCLMSLHYARTC